MRWREQRQSGNVEDRRGMSGGRKIAVGGGGIPVVADENGDLRGIAAVIDKDLASALLARNVGAELLIISTGVEKVALNWGKPDQRFIDSMTMDEAKGYLAEGVHFAKGSMAPKISAAIEYLEGFDGTVIITDPAHIQEAVEGRTGTRITR